MKIIVDAFGGDHAPLEILKGAMQAVDAYDVDIILTGKEAEIRRCAAENRLQLRRTRIVDAPQVITMEDDAKSVLRSKKDSSLGVAFQLLKAGEGDALVSAGNTGAVTVGATLITGRIKGVKRPAIASVMPSASKPFLMMDCGANAECKPEFLCQFGLLGSLYMQHVLHVKNPRVALANNGTEPTKGTPTVRAAYDLMTAAPYNFVGNIEGRQIPFGGGCGGGRRLYRQPDLKDLRGRGQGADERDEGPVQEERLYAAVCPGCVRWAKEYESQVRL